MNYDFTVQLFFKIKIHDENELIENRQLITDFNLYN